MTTLIEKYAMQKRSAELSNAYVFSLTYCLNTAVLPLNRLSFLAKYVYVGFQIVELVPSPNLIFPSCSYLENKSFFLNYPGTIQRTTKIKQRLMGTSSIASLVAGFFLATHSAIADVFITPQYRELIWFSQSESQAFFLENNKLVDYADKANFEFLARNILDLNVHFQGLRDTIHPLTSDEARLSKTKGHDFYFYEDKNYFNYSPAFNAMMSGSIFATYITPVIPYVHNFFCTDTVTKLSTVMALNSLALAKYEIL